MAPSVISSDEYGIPVIDFARIEGPEHQAVCQQIADACGSWGFFHLINHGVDPSLMKRAKQLSIEFFHRSEEEKLKIRCPAGVHPVAAEGWHHPKYRSKGEALKQDMVEHLLYSSWPDLQTPSVEYKTTFLEYRKELKSLAEKLFGVLSERLGLSSDALLSAIIGGSPSDCLTVRVRTNFYGLDENGEAIPWKLESHSDAGGMTILLADDVPGLEIKKDGQWVGVNPIPGGFVVNISDMTEICSNGHYKSVEHRGMPGYRQERLSIATFCGPPMDSRSIGPIPALLDEHHRAHYKTTDFESFVQELFKKGLGGERLIESYKIREVLNQSTIYSH